MMTASFDSDCPACGQRIHEGDPIRKGEYPTAQHDVCPEQPMRSAGEGEHTDAQLNNTDRHEGEHQGDGSGADHGASTGGEEVTNPEGEQHSDGAEQARASDDVVVDASTTSTAVQLSNIEQEIKRARDAAAKKIAALKRQQAKLDAALDKQVVALLKKQHATIYEQLVSEAHVELEKQRNQRSEKSKAARSKAAS